MFCPQCAAQNEPEQGYCWQCGQLLFSVQLALEGRVDDAIVKFKKAEDSLSSGLLTLVIFLIIGVVSGLPFGIETFAINLILGLIIGLPLIVRGMVRLQRVGRVLNADIKSDSTLLYQSERKNISLSTAR